MLNNDVISVPDKWEFPWVNKYIVHKSLHLRLFVLVHLFLSYLRF